MTRWMPQLLQEMSILIQLIKTHLFNILLHGKVLIIVIKKFFDLYTNTDQVKNDGLERSS